MAQIWFHQSLITFLNTSFPHRRVTLVCLRKLKLIVVIAECIGRSQFHRIPRLTFTSYKRVRYKRVPKVQGDVDSMGNRVQKSIRIRTLADRLGNHRWNIHRHWNILNGRNLRFFNDDESRVCRGYVNGRIDLRPSDDLDRLHNHTARKYSDFHPLDLLTIV